jgi:prepilin-type N-terminal cleavage/methylation domain-containing protein
VTQGGFTLVELLVVVTIIVILLAMLAPALDSAIEQAERAVCATNLHAFGTASSGYAMNNRRRLLTIPRHYKMAGPISGNAGGLAYPWFVWLYAQTMPAEFSMEAIRPYIGETQPTSPQTATMGELWLCPASQMAQVRADNENFYIKQPPGPVLGAQDDGPGILCEYAYFGGGGGTVPAGYVTTRSTINNGKLGGQGVLMGDNLFRHSEPAWYYNHGEYTKYPGSPPDIQGMNVVNGDGSALWDEWDDTRRKAAYSVGPKDEMGDYVSATGQATGSDPAAGDLFTFY